MESQPFEQFSVTLPGEMARVIHERVSSGDYGSVSELIQDAMRAWLHRERRLAVLDASLVRGMAEVDAGQGENAEQVRKCTISSVGDHPVSSVEDHLIS